MGALIRRRGVWHLLVVAGLLCLGRCGDCRHGDILRDLGAMGPLVNGEARTAPGLAGGLRVEGGRHAG
eukprot:2048485-Alexandrium_andersonii.AAC.1